jgi:hypothetical protein
MLGAPSECEMTVGHGFLPGNQPDHGGDRDLPYQFGFALARNRQLCYGRRYLGTATWEISDKGPCWFEADATTQTKALQ